jgi:hypothetical protein
MYREQNIIVYKTSFSLLLFRLNFRYFTAGLVVWGPDCETEGPGLKSRGFVMNNLHLRVMAVYIYQYNLYNVFSTYPIKPKPTHVKRCI